MVHPKLACSFSVLLLFFASQMFSQDILLGFTLDPPNPSSQCETTIEIEYVTQDGCNNCWLANYYLSGSNTWVFDFECIAILVIPCPTDYVTTTEQISLGQLPEDSYAVLEYYYGVPQNVVGTFDVIDEINITSENGTANLSVDGNTVTVTDWPVINSGNTPTGNFSACVYLSEDANITSSDYLIHIENGLNVAKNATSIEDFTIDLDTLGSPPPSGNYYLGIILDCAEEINESDETDNVVEFVGGGYPQIEIGSPVNCQTNDYTAATDFYNQTNGPGWTNSTGWFSSNPIMGFWNGIAQTNGCVTQLSLPNNDLSGDIPDAVGGFSELQSLSLVGNGLTGTVPDTLASLANITGIYLGQNELTGTVPEAILELPSLTEFNIDFNNIDSLPPIVNPNLTLWVNNNQLTFDDILPTIDSVDAFIYGNQDSIGVATSMSANAGSNITIDLVFDDTVSTNRYFWYKDGVLLTTPSMPIIGDNSLTLSNISAADAGIYWCEVTNPLAPNLTLHIKPFIFEVTGGGCQMNCLTPPPFELDNNGEVTIMAVELLENNGAACPSGDFQLEIFNSVGTSLGAAAASQMMDCSHLGEAFTFRVTDVNTGEFCEGSLTVEDNDPPTMFCVAEQTIDITTNGQADILASAFDAGIFDNCTLDIPLSFSTNPSDNFRVYDCSDIGTIELMVWGTDESGNQEFCFVDLIVQDPAGNCAIPQPDTLIISASDEMAEVGEQFCFDVTVQNFTEIISMQYSMDFDSDVLQFENVQAFGLPNFDQGDFGTLNASNGILTLSWIDPSLMGVTLTDGSTIFEVCFTVLCAPVGGYGFNFSGSPTSIEVTNSNQQQIPVEFQSGILQNTGENISPTPSCLTTYVVEVNTPVNASDLDDGSTDNCSTNLDFSFSPDPSNNSISFSCGQLGTNTVDLWVTDEFGNQSTCSVSVTVTDLLNQCIPSDCADDSLALVDLYLSTNGSTDWTFSTNWLNPDSVINSWYGVDADPNGCVNYLLLGNNNLTGSLPANLGDLNSLIGLELDTNNLTGEIPSSIGQMSDLVYIFLNKNNLTGEIPASFGQLDQLEELFLSYNNLSGEIPPELGDMESLIDLFAHFNNLEGEIPEELGNLQNLFWLDLDSNMLVGGIPTSLSQLSNLNGLELHMNQLSDTIPDGLTTLNELRVLNLSANNLTGEIPETIGDLNNLEYLNFSFNELTGTIPPAIGGIPGLQGIYLNDNFFHSCFEDELLPLCGIDYDFINNPELPWQGNFQLFCDSQAQTGATCDDGNPNTTGDAIQADCSCIGCPTDPFTGEENYAGCSGDGYEVIVNGTVYNEDNPMGTELLTTFYSCDSIVTIDLQFLDGVFGEENYSGCTGDGYSVTVGGTVYDEDNPMGTETIFSAAGCDSTITIDLMFFEAVFGEENYMGCLDDGYEVEVNGTIYNQANPNGEETLISAVGCDSIVTIDLQFFNTEDIEINYTGCSGDGYEVEVNGTVYNEANPNGTELMTTSMGCDSTVTVDLDFLAIASENISYTGCSGDGYSIEINGTIYDESNQMGTETLTATNGCDSIVNIALTFNEVFSADYSPTLCTGASVEINGTVYDESNPSGVEIFQTVNGCDSTVMIELSFDEVVTENLALELCDGESIVVGGTLFDENYTSGEVVFEGGSVFGCDSVVQVELEFFEDINLEINETLCAGESIEVNGEIYDEENPVGTETMTSSTGCDSTVSISLDFIYSESDFEQTICPGESIFINGNEYGENNPSGTEILAGASYLGCDSVVNISLAILATVAEIPNVFTPNGDGVNDTFDPLSFYEINGCSNSNITAAELTIFNRWGDAIYRSGGKYVPWPGINGTGDNGPDVPDGTYYYFLKLSAVTGDEEVRGAINVLRGN